MLFRDRVLASLTSMRPVLEVPGVMVGGSQVPNLLEPDAASTLIVSQDVDLIVPVTSHREVIKALDRIHDYTPSSDEPSVWIPNDSTRLEINFIGMDREIRESSDSYMIDDTVLPLLVFGLLSHLQEGRAIDVDGLEVQLPRPAGLFIEKLRSERSGLKGERDLLVALGLLGLMSGTDLEECLELIRALNVEQRNSILVNLTVLSLMKAIPGMPDPVEGRADVAALIRRLETLGS